jgi:hypothetical protein
MCVVSPPRPSCSLAVELASAVVDLVGATLPLFLFFASLDLEAGVLLRGIPSRPVRAQGRRQRAPPHACGSLPPGGRQLPLRMRFGLHNTAGSYSFLRVGYILFPAAYQWVMQMQTGYLLEMV